MNTIEEIRKFVEDECKKYYNNFGYEIWLYHILPAAKYAKILATKFGADEEIVEVATLLHDIGSIKYGDVENHHALGAEGAKRILKKFGYPQEKIEKITHCIHSHRGSKKIKRQTKEAECVASADAMAHFDNIPSYLHFSFVKLQRNISEGTEFVKSHLERSWNKLIPEAKEFVKDRYEASKLILQNSFET